MRFFLLFCSLFFVICAGCRESVVEKTVTRGAGQQDVAMVKASNDKMNAAMDEARRTVSQFTDAMKNPKPGQQFIIKVRVTDGKATEYMWLRDLSFDGNAFHGALMDDPYQVKGYKMGQQMVVPKDKISDWMILDGDKRTGGYTEKVLEGQNPS